MSGAQGNTFVITGATGSVGRAAMARLEAMGHAARPIARRSGVSFDDPEALDRAYRFLRAAEHREYRWYTPPERCTEEVRGEIRQAIQAIEK